MGTSPLTALGIELPVIAAPMAGGPTTVDLVLAAAGAGALGFLAAGYKTPAVLDEQLSAVRAAGVGYGVNLFAPNPLPVDAATYARYREQVRPDAARLGADVPEEPIEDDDHWQDKIDLLLAHPAPVVSFTFGIPSADVVQALHGAGSLLVQTVTTVAEAGEAARAGLDAVAVQGFGAGGHSGTTIPQHLPAQRPLVDLVAEIADQVRLPVIAAGGLADTDSVRAVLTAGAVAAMVGTALLLAPEAGTSVVHRAALQDGTRGDTVLTRAFTGRPARGLPTQFMTAHESDAPLGYPAVHHLTSPMRKAAAAVGDPEHVNLWAGVGYRSTIARPAAQTLQMLAG